MREPDATMSPELACHAWIMPGSSRPGRSVGEEGSTCDLRLASGGSLCTGATVHPYHALLQCSSPRQNVVRRMFLVSVLALTATLAVSA